MADLQHNTLTSSQVHEPKHITSANVTDSGKVITSSSSVSGQSEYRRLLEEDLDGVVDYVTISQPDATSTNTMYWPAPYAGTILSWIAVLESTFATDANDYELKIDGVAVATTSITIDETDNEGDQFSATATGTNIFTQSQNVEIVPTSVANTDATGAVRFVIAIQRA